MTRSKKPWTPYRNMQPDVNQRERWPPPSENALHQRDVERMGDEGEALDEPETQFRGSRPGVPSRIRQALGRMWEKRG